MGRDDIKRDLKKIEYGDVKCVYVTYDEDWNCTAAVETAIRKSAPKEEENHSNKSTN